MNGPTILTYNLDSLTRSGVQALCRYLGFHFKSVARSEFALPIGLLAGIPMKAPASPVPEAAFSDPMLVMCHLLGDQLDAFLQGLRAQGIRIPLKAVLTPSNVGWSAPQLHAELLSEHEAMRSALRKP